MRFFTFKEIAFPTVNLSHPSYPMISQVTPGQRYFLTRDQYDETINQDVVKEGPSVSSMVDEDLAAVTFEIDPSLSAVPDEHVRLAKYMKEKNVSIDLYDGNSRFLWASG